MRKWLKSRLPGVASAYQKACRRFRLTRAYVRYSSEIAFHRVWYPDESIFRVIYRKKMWGTESGSGAGSSLAQTTVLRSELPTLMHRIGARTILDAACGDFHFMKEVPLEVDRYIGVEIVPELVGRNQRSFGGEKISFRHADISEDELPTVDLIICRDVLVHLSFEKCLRCISNFKKTQSEFLLTTTYPGLLRSNKNVLCGMWRPIDLELAPFSFPPPLALMSEQTTEDTDYSQKSLGLWRVKDLPS